MYIAEQRDKHVKVSTGNFTFRKRMISHLSLGGRVEEYKEKSSLCRTCWGKCKWLCCFANRSNKGCIRLSKLDENKEDESDIAVIPNADKDLLLFLNTGGFNAIQNPYRSLLGELVMNSKRTNLEENFKDENFGDGLMEILVFPGIEDKARRIAKDTGPFKLAFQTNTVFFK
jgi:hypothetical protein